MRADYTLDSKYELDSGWVYLTGIQALVRLPLDQVRRDRARGLNTGCYISGYEGSPLGGYDLALQRVSRLLSENNIHFEPGVNEDLAATAVMGSQIADIVPKPRYDGVVGIWYGKGPGVDRSGDAFRHANLAGTGRNGGALALAGDDHVSKSSTIPHQSEISLYNVGMPTLSAGTVQQVLDFGLLGIEMSRFSGAWTGAQAGDGCLRRRGHGRGVTGAVAGGATGIPGGRRALRENLAAVANCSQLLGAGAGNARQPPGGGPAVCLRE